MTTVEYDELCDQFYFQCRDCGETGRGWDRRRDADLDADRHDQLHDDNVI